MFRNGEILNTLIVLKAHLMDEWRKFELYQYFSKCVGVKFRESNPLGD
jgi:hypothetical protein